MQGKSTKPSRPTEAQEKGSGTHSAVPAWGIKGHKDEQRTFVKGTAPEPNALKSIRSAGRIFEGSTEPDPGLSSGPMPEQSG